MILEMTGGQHELLLVLKDIKALQNPPLCTCRHVSVKRRRVLILHIFFHIKKKVFIYVEDLLLIGSHCVTAITNNKAVAKSQMYFSSLQAPHH